MATFDIQGARDAGFSEEEIQDFIARRNLNIEEPEDRPEQFKPQPFFPWATEKVGGITRGVGGFVLPRTLPVAEDIVETDKALLPGTPNVLPADNIIAQSLAAKREAARLEPGVERLLATASADVPIARQALASGTEIGTLLGAGQLQKGLGFIKAGVIGGGLRGLTDPTTESLLETVEKGATGAAIGAIIGGVLKVTSSGLKWISGATSNLKQKAAQQILRQTPSQVKLTHQGKNWLADQLVQKLDDGDLKPGGYNDMLLQADDLLTQADDQLQNTLKGNTNTIKTKSLFSQVNKLIENYKRQGLSNRADTLIEWKESIINEWGDDLTYQEVNQLKKLMYKGLSDSALKKQATDIASTQVAGMRALASQAMRYVRDNVKGTSKLLDDESFYIQLQQALHKQLQKAGGAPITGQGFFGGITGLIGRQATKPLTGPKFLSQMLTGGARQAPGQAVGAGVGVAGQALGNPLLQQILTGQAIQATR